MRFWRTPGSSALALCSVLVVWLSLLVMPAHATYYVYDTGESGWWGQSSDPASPDYWEPISDVPNAGPWSRVPLWPEGYEYSPFYAWMPLTGSYGGMYVQGNINLSNSHPTEAAHITLELWRYADQATPEELLGTSWLTVPPGRSSRGLIFGWRLEQGIPEFNGELLVIKIIYDNPQTNGARVSWGGETSQMYFSIYDEPQGLNPHVRAYIDFSPPDYVHSVMPEPYDVVDAFLVLDCFGHSEDDDVGMTVICLTIDITPGMSLSTSFTSLLPNGVHIGEWETGISLASGDCCAPDGSAPENNGVVFVGKISMVYSGVPGDVVIADHPLFPRWLVGCLQGDENRFRVFSHGGVGQPPSAPGDFGADECYASSSAVEHSSWGAIKAMFR